ncbi:MULTISPECIES: TonB-dependent receptor [unclassified Imperialibacter]|uniref:TonB-dependent receptor n=1 Tax=unclassified Imperialibacter TaxID=2629706 RepID=UPI00125C94C7|nr:MULTISPECIES: TonB-dependent receptor [unclassified Imperialibacter]CAD5266768.1 TonB-dependent receptor [Imperialibacter sp. 89]CAD5281918.1 TonB-dependent receptor [Imperialibacter sp. 75]VVT17050.1 TonB-dependent receptor [Imperialibacter sp. EC-SDR9]
MRYLLLFSLFCVTSIAFAQSNTISGYVRDRETGESLIGANVFDKSTLKGTTTNHFGYYTLPLSYSEVHLVFSYVGYLPIDTLITLKGNVELSIRLIPQSMLDEIVVTAEEDLVDMPQMSKIGIPVDQIKSLPALAGEVDIFKALQLMPGIQSGSEGSSGLYVRGGGPDQNLILLDGVPVYNASHLFGFFSVFNADAINNVEVIKGGFPARYGGRLSSVIDISMKEGNNRELKGTGSIGLISSKLTLEGPLKKEKSSFIVSARRTYIDILARPLIKANTDGDETAGYFFYDLNAKVNYTFSDRDRIYLSTYTGDDKAYARSKDFYVSDNTRYDYKDEFGLKWGNITSAFRWNHVFSPKIFSNVTATYSKYQFDIFQEYYNKTTTPTETTEDSGATRYFSGIQDLALKTDFEFTPHVDHQLRAGASAIHHTFNPGILAYTASNDADTTLGSTKTRGLELATYFEDDWTISKAIRVNAGVHFSAFNVNNIWYQKVQPRINARYLFGNGLAIKASYATMAQFIHLLTNSSIGLPTDLWVPATKNIKPQYSSQVAIGVAKNITKTYEVSIEAYYKDMTNLIEYSEGASYIDPQKDWQSKVSTGNGVSYGTELLIQKKTGRFSGWIGYTLSRTERTFPDLNFGKTYPYKYDRRHDVSLVGIYKVRDDFEFSATWVYGTGNAVSLPEERYAGQGHSYSTGPGGQTYYYYNELLDYPSRNNYRMRAYHRLDISVSKTKKKKWGQQTWSFGAYNAYSRSNPFFMDIGYDRSGNKKFKQYSLFPIIPSVRYNFEF